MAVWDEVPPGSVGTGVPQSDPKQALFAALLSKFGRPSATQDGESTQQTSAITPLANLPGAPGNPPSGMPTGVPGVPPSNLPQGTGAPQSRPMPGPNAMLSGSFAYPNKQARNAAVVATGIENMSEAIHNFKVEKDQNEFQKAKNTWDLYQKAAAVNPETGQPVDPHTMAILAKDPKIVKGWEKYLKMEFPREAGAPDPKTGKPTQGQPQIPAPQAPAAAQSKQLIEQRQLEQLRGAPGETGGLTPAEAHKAALMEAGIVPKEKDQKAFDKIDAEIDNLKAEKLQHEADVKRLDAETQRLGPSDPLRLAQIQAEKALAVERLAQANKDLQGATKSKTLQEFTVGRGSIKDVLTQQSKALTKMQSSAMAERSKFGKLLGTTPDVSPEQDAQQNRVSSLNDAYTSYVGMQDDVESGRITATDAMLKARRSANLDSDFNLWGGVPSDAPQTPPKELPEGYAMKNADGIDVAVKQGNKWVAP